MNPMGSGLGTICCSRPSGPFGDLVAGAAAQGNEPIEASTGGHFVGVLTVSTLFARPLFGAHTYKAVISND
jgi:hypothetical protein